MRLVRNLGKQKLFIYFSCLDKFCAVRAAPLAKIVTPLQERAAGEMAEWLKAHAWKACVRETVPWVRIPLSPPYLMLKLELTDLSRLGADLKVLGFNEQELAAALGRSPGGLVHEDDVPDLGQIAVAKPGDVWLLGPHRIGCGDSRDGGIVSPVLGGAVPQLMVTDPPYGVEYDPAWRHRRGVNNSARKDKIRNDEVADWSPAWNLFPGEIA